MHVDRLAPAVALLALAISGCGDDNPLGRRAVGGTVLLRGQPLQQGSIQFSPVDLQTGVGSGAVVLNGAYQIPEEQGLPPGTYRVIISAGDTGAAASSDAPPGASGKLAVELIPAEWNVDSKHTVDLKPDGDSELNFDIK